MHYLDIIEWIVRALAIVYALTITVIVVVGKFRKNKTAGKPKTPADIFAEVGESVMDIIKEVEEQYSSFTVNAKSGAFKLYTALNRIHELCSAKGIKFDKALWTEFINANVKKANEVQSTGQSVQVQFIGGNK